LLSQPAFAKLGDKAKSSAEPAGYTCKSGKAVRGKKGCKEYGGSNSSRAVNDEARSGKPTGFLFSGGIDYRCAMAEQDSGFDILVNGSTRRTFRDDEASAIHAARQLAGRKENDPVRVRNRRTGATVTVTADGSVKP
jgi:hypothetical protein